MRKISVLDTNFLSSNDRQIRYAPFRKLLSKKFNVYGLQASVVVEEFPKVKYYFSITKNYIKTFKLLTTPILDLILNDLPDLENWELTMSSSPLSDRLNFSLEVNMLSMTSGLKDTHMSVAKVRECITRSVSKINKELALQGMMDSKLGEAYKEALGNQKRRKGTETTLSMSAILALASNSPF